MKILVISDVHGRISLAERMLERENPDEVFFLGDGLREISESAKFFPKIRFHMVAGNCDFMAGKEQCVIKISGKNIFYTHGHRYNVKMEREMNYITLRSAAMDCGADIVLFGHTHQPDLFFMNGMCIMNPGAAAAGKYGIIEINRNEIKPELRTLYD